MLEIWMIAFFQAKKSWPNWPAKQGKLPTRREGNSFKKQVD